MIRRDIPNLTYLIWDEADLFCIFGQSKTEKREDNKKTNCESKEINWKKERLTSQRLHICHPRGVSCGSLQHTSLLTEHTPERWLQPRQRCSCLLCRSPTTWVSLTPPWIITPSWRRWSCWTLQGPHSSMPRHLKAQALALVIPASSLITLLEVSTKSLLIKLHGEKAACCFHTENCGRCLLVQKCICVHQ